MQLEEIGRLQLRNDHRLGCALVEMYGRIGALQKAHEVFEYILVKDIDAWNALIAAYGTHGCVDDTVRCFKEMEAEGISPNLATYVSLSKAYIATEDINKATEVLAEIQVEDLSEVDAITGSSLIDAYAKCGLMEKATKVFDKLPSRNIVTWNTLITACVGNGCNKEALCYFDQMQCEGVFPDAVTFICCLKACGNLVLPNRVNELYSQIKRLGLLDRDQLEEIGRLQFRNDHRLGCALVEMYGRIGALQKAHEVFEYILVKDIDAWNALIAAYGTHGCVDDTVRCFKEMEAEGISPNLATYVSLSKAYIATEDINKATEILAEIQVEDLSEVDAITGSSLIDAYAKCGLMEKATKVFDKLPSQNIVTWNTLITACVGNGCNKEALCYFDQMQCEGVFPDAVTFICCLKACGNLVLPNRVNELYSQIKRLGLLDRDQVGNTLVLAFARCGLLNMAWSVFFPLTRETEKG
ncbi:hypothetical protein KP509_14G008900 [Ceratopteris richardii]|uniref:Pentatricopeptide repeat-containing protein n=1 Tax=Ceratopteris richardii TaxID=49495 RepID=A0A8T2T9E8_CERRI|nr:hypothetical protein KP509_14G008900 [Ceratopteris richardii]